MLIKKVVNQDFQDILDINTKLSIIIKLKLQIRCIEYIIDYTNLKTTKS